MESRPPLVSIPWDRQSFAALVQPPVIGMVHLPPLPGAPDWDGDFPSVVRRTLAAAETLAGGGVGAIMLENFHDAPFHPRAVGPETVAAMAVLTAAVRRLLPKLPLGVNVLRNDAAAALAIAQTAGAQFIRVNVHAGAAVTDQGLLEGQAQHTLRMRRRLLAAVAILADLRVKHSAPLAVRPLAEEACDLRQRGRADGLILTGPATGAPADPQELRDVRKVLPDCPLLVGSGAHCGNVVEFARWADGYIVGTALQTDDPGRWPTVDARKVAAFVAAVGAGHQAERETTC